MSDKRNRISSETGGAPVAVEVTRGDAVESRHSAVAAVVDHTGRLIAHMGDPEYVTFSRSALKPLQALPTVLRGFPDLYGLAERHVAVMCGSHSGEGCHATAAQDILTAIGRTVADYQCGVHVPLSYRVGDGAIPSKSEFTALYNNCSGKHAGMLALAEILGCPPEEYLVVDSSVQQAIRETLISMTDVDEGSFFLGTDGCSAPNYALPIRNLATGFARLARAANPDLASEDDVSRGGARVIDAMKNHPEMVSGTGRLDLALAQASEGRLVTKIGAEAMQCIAVPERGWGITVKVTDGNARALGPLVVAILNELGLLDELATAKLRSIAHPELRNHRGIVTGTIRIVTGLQKC